MTHERKAIRKYTQELLKDGVDVGRRVFTNRPSVMFDGELPLVLIYFAGEQNELWIGDKWVPRTYLRQNQVAICVIVEQQINPDAAINENQDGEDLIDDLCEEIEHAMFDDNFFEKRLPGYDDAKKDNDGLLNGMTLDSTVPYEIDTESEREIIGSKMLFTLPYLRNVYPEERAKQFLSYLVEIRKINETASTVDPILTAAEGDVR